MSERICVNGNAPENAIIWEKCKTFVNTTMQGQIVKNAEDDLPPGPGPAPRPGGDGALSRACGGGARGSRVRDTVLLLRVLIRWFLRGLGVRLCNGHLRCRPKGRLGKLLFLQRILQHRV